MYLLIKYNQNNATFYKMTTERYYNYKSLFIKTNKDTYKINSMASLYAFAYAIGPCWFKAQVSPENGTYNHFPVWNISFNKNTNKM